MRLKGGASLISRPPSFSTDGKLLLVCTGSSVSIFSVATGLQVSELEGHTGLVTSINVVEYTEAAKSLINHVWTSSLDGTARFWNFTTGALIKTVNVGKPIHSMVIPRHCKSGSKAAYKHDIGLLLVEHKRDTCECQEDEKVSKDSKGGNGHLEIEPGFRVILHNLTSQKPLDGHLVQVSSPHLLICSQLGGLVGLVDNRKIWVWRVSRKGIQSVESFQQVILHHTKTLQALAFDPTETLVAGSDSSGRVLIWKNVGESAYVSPLKDKGKHTKKNSKNGVDLDLNRGVRGDDDAAALSSYHWHSDQVNFLMFSLDGAYLFSGGEEAVFVMWQLETGEKRFLPRLGSSILHFAGSSDASIVSVACADNSIKLINLGTMAVQKSIQGIKPPVSLPKKMKKLDAKAVAFQPGTGNLVLPAKDMSLQFYAIVHDQQSGEVQVTPHNYVSGKERETSSVDGEQTNILPVFITHVVFSRDGSSMATAECCQGEENIGRGSCLKFWRRDLTQSNFILSTRIEDPHNLEISSLVFHPNLNLAVSCCSLGEFKVWTYDEGRQKAASPSSWRCRSVGSYRQKQMLSADFSTDGTLLSISAEELITLWNPFSNGLIHVLGRSSMNAIKFLRFVPSTHYLVVASGGTPPELTVWNLETLSILWSYRIAVEALSVDPRGSHFSILGEADELSEGKGSHRGSQALLTVFDANSPAPLVTWSVRDVEESCMLWLPSSDVNDEGSINDKKQDSDQSYLVLLSRQREYTVFDPLTQKDALEPASKKSFDRVENKGLSTFAKVYGKAVHALPRPERAFLESGGAQPQGKFLNCPSHLISLKSIGFSYIESLLERKTGVAQ
ncbi:hypothetical protein GOP47_0012792 [Adiantum capillus-veneris]|uniref:WD repeat-containing protein 75 second beta-propeller domain-containing protein n=1 Tax=Adiantum capillus-veneris TaxID=13818 RepID=A0A9D4ZH54_ADICA|nr:hypothetical protein GOP47_0012792 [Adiantum capillus-veneris]